MHNLKAIRALLAVSQQTLAEGLGCTQGNVSLYERGQNLPPDVCRRLVAFARARGLDITFEHVYESAELPTIKAEAGTSEAADAHQAAAA